MRYTTRWNSFVTIRRSTPIVAWVFDPYFFLHTTKANSKVLTTPSVTIPLPLNSYRLRHLVSTSNLLLGWVDNYLSYLYIILKDIQCHKFKLFEQFQVIKFTKC